jgi:hypothetical protein
MVSSGESWVLDGYPLVKLQKTMERPTMLLMGKPWEHHGKIVIYMEILKYSQFFKG